MSPWTDEEVSTLVSMWPTSTVMQIACALRRPYSTMRSKVRELCKKGLLESKKAGRRGRSIKPDPQDFDEVKRDYSRKHHITAAELGARFERDGQLAAELYRLALEAGLTRVRSRQPSIQKYHPDRQGAEEGKPKE